MRHSLLIGFEHPEMASSPRFSLRLVGEYGRRWLYSRRHRSPTLHHVRTHTALEEAVALRLLPPPRERRQVRELAGLSQRRIGDEIGVSGQAVAHYEAGTRTPRGERLMRYVAILTELTALSEGSW
jgi:DNA-binding XRE family transcriptional regulator